MKKLLILSISLLGGSLVMAQNRRTIAQTQNKQCVHIAHGYHSVMLTPYEAKQLVYQQKHIQHMKRAAKADGYITRRESAYIKNAQASARVDIYQKKHTNRNHNHY